MIPLLCLLVGATPSEKSVLAELERLDKALVASETRLREVEAQRASLHKELASIETERAVAEVRKAEALQRYSRRLEVLARMPAGARLVLLGGSRSLADYLETTRVLRWIAAHDKSLHRGYVQEAERLARLEASLEARRGQIEALEVEQRQQRDQLAERRQERADLLASVLRTKATAARAGRERRAARRALADMIGKLKPAGRPASRFADNRGRLPWPALGRVDVPFGQQIEREFGTVTTQNGCDIRAVAGARVQAVFAGTVVYSDWLRGYGRLVIIDHGEGYHTLYAHLGEETVQRGDSVSQGDEIGTVGDTGSLRGTVLYFEIREKRLPVDPELWLR